MFQSYHAAIHVPSAKRFRVLFTALLLVFIVSGCKKKMTLPNESLNKIFGTWEWVQSTGGYSGTRMTPASTGNSQTIEFNINGTYRWFKDDKRQGKVTYTITEDKSMMMGGTAYMITYGKSNVFDKNAPGIKQSVSFAGSDTLFLHDECYDCYGHTYVRRK